MLPKSAFSVGGVAIGCSGDPWLLERLQPYLEPYSTDRSPNLEIFVQTGESRHHLAGESDVAVEFRPEGLFFRQQHMDAVWDSTAKRLSLTIDREYRQKIRFYFQLLLRSFLTQWLISNRGLALHASSIVREGRAWLFVGQSGAGKSTIVRKFGGGVTLNDDFSAVRKIDDRFLACGTPIRTRKDFTFLAQDAPVAGVFRIVQAQRLRVNPAPAAEFLPSLVHNTYCFTRDSEVDRLLLSTCTEFVRTVKCAILEFNLVDDIWKAVEELC